MRTRFLLWLAICLVTVLSLTPIAGAGTASTAVPAPVKAPGSIGAMLGNPGDWYVGATPPNFDPSKPVLVFVPGKGSTADMWWTDTAYHGVNDMYAFAYAAGYRTAFVNLYPESSMWENGALLNQLLGQITAYFGVSRVTIIAHSKGGIDANTASVYDGASSKIDRVITLGTPHWGSPLADMAYSTWTWWLAVLLHQRNDATYVLQTGYMSYYRSITDGRDPGVAYYTLSGDSCGPLFSGLWMGCVAISGPNDGLVPEPSAHKPGATQLRLGHWDHDDIRMGSRTWDWFAPVLQPTGSSGGATLAVAAAAARPAAPGNLILRGGSTASSAAAAFPIESQVRSATFTFLASSPDFTATLTGPGGTAYRVTMNGQVPAGEVFAGAWTGTVQVPTPAAGQWRLQTAAGKKSGYVMMAGLDSDLTATLAFGQAVATPGGQQSLTVGFGPGRAPASSRTAADVSLNGQQPYGRPAFQAAGGGQVAVLNLPTAAGIHNVTVTVTGTLPDGTAFERTLVSSFAAVDPAQRGSWR